MNNENGKGILQRLRGAGSERGLSYLELLVAATVLLIEGRCCVPAAREWAREQASE